ncbi:MAG: hypothetical protein J3Q66DRAFT_353361 [Benniella sp.]|nr:MAG: hypothetical protein J3Q66DRAFT_353361 [Benniella sp.]
MARPTTATLLLQVLLLQVPLLRPIPPAHSGSYSHMAPAFGNWVVHMSLAGVLIQTLSSPRSSSPRLLSTSA